MGHPDPIAFTIFGIDIRWYGILIACGMLLAVLISCKRAPRHGITDEDVLDIAIWMLPIGVIGARVYYVIFNLDYYTTLSSMLDIRSGGLAIHGGLIFSIITVYIICRRKKIDPFNVFDLFIPTVALAQSIGRWGNYFNGEAHGGPTDLPWGILVDGVKVHPTFLYESIWCLLLFIALYSVERFFVESLRTDSLMIGPFKQAQVISLFAIVIGIFLYRYASVNKRIDTPDKQ